MDRYAGIPESTIRSWVREKPGITVLELPSGKAFRVREIPAIDQAKDWDKPGTLTIVYKPSKRQWFASFTVKTEDTVPKLQLVADLRSFLPSLNSKLDRRGVLLHLSYPRSVPAIKKAPIKSPNTSQQHLWIVDIVVPIVLEVAIGKSMCGEHS